MGEYESSVSIGNDTFSIREPLGVCTGICPFNFPAMIPLWVCLNLPFLPSQFVCNRRLGTNGHLNYVTVIPLHSYFNMICAVFMSIIF
jgi:hypothetical protein